MGYGERGVGRVLVFETRIVEVVETTRERRGGGDGK
jgi:hypothetical protein